MHYKRPDQLRKVAILLASLDESLAAELLREFPTAEAVKIRELVARLGEIDPEEQSDVLDEFRHSSQLQGSFGQTTDDLAVEIDASLQRQMELLASEPAAGESAAETDCVATAAHFGDERQQALAEAAGPTLAKLLETEHPQTIALVLSRLSEQQAAETLIHLSQTKQAESIERLVHLSPAASEVVEELESQIANSIAEQRLQQENFAAGSSLARRILALTSPAAKAAILERIEQSDKLVAESLTTSSLSEIAPAAQSTLWSNPYAQSPEASLMSRSNVDSRQDDSQQENSTGDRGETCPDLETAPALPSPSVAQDCFEQDCFDQDSADKDSSASPELPEASWETQETYDPELLETIDASTLAALFDAVGERATQLVLAAASDALLRRVLGQLPRREAKLLRQKIRQFGPTPLSELFAAQQQILQIADRSGVLKLQSA